jgi:cell division protein FtsQ
MRPRKKIRKNIMVDRRKRGKIYSLAKYAVIVIVPSALILMMIYAAPLVFNSVFRIADIVITGNGHLTDDELKTMAGLNNEQNLLRVSGSGISSKLAESPWIRSVSVRKEFPDRLLISIKEAEPFALLDMKGKLFIVDDRGTMLEELKDIAVPFLPVISSNPYKEKEAFQEAINLAKTIKSTALLSRKDHIEIISHKPEELSMNIDGRLVKIGMGEYEDKLSRLNDIEQEIEKRKIPVDYIDLRFANRVLVSPVKEVIR